jgi:hypothetical protein
MIDIDRAEYCGALGLGSVDLGLEDGGTNLTDIQAAAMRFPSKEAVV